MKALLFFSIILLMLGMVGCETEKVVEVPSDEPVVILYDVNFTNGPEVVNLLPNRSIDVPIEVVVHKKDGGIGTGARVEFYETTRFGTFVTSVDTADNDGKTSTIFRTTPNRYGTCRIFVLVAGGRADAEFQIRPITVPASIEIVGNGHIKVIPGENGIIQFGVICTDSNLVGIPNVPVSARFSSYNGGATFGVISADLRFSSLGLYGREWLVVTTNIPELETQLSDSALITVERLTNNNWSMTARTYPGFINLQPDSIGYAEIRVVVRDENNVGVAGLIIDAVTDLGTIVSPDTTDSNGVAIFPITFMGEEGIAHIIFTIRGTEYEATAQIVVTNREEASQKTLIVYSDYMEIFPDHLIVRPDSLAKVTFWAVVKDEQGQVLPSGEIVDLMTDWGRFESTPLITGQRVVWNNDYREGIAHLAFQLRGTNSVQTTEIEVEFEPAPGRIDLTIEPDTILAGSNEPIHLAMLVTDGHGNPIANQQVQINADLGTIVDITLTDSTGRAEGSMIFNNISSGVVGIQAYIGDVSDTALLWILPDESPNSIQLIYDGSEVEVGGSIALRVVVLTAENRPITQTVTVVVEILNEGAPNGPQFPNGARIDSARTINGEVTLTLLVGETAGAILMQAYTWRDPETRLNRISTGIIPVIPVVSGPPASLDIDINDGGEDAGSGNWRVPVTARVYDRRFNPISNVDVNFRVEPDSVASIVPGRQGEAWIVYHGERSFNPITVFASIDTGNGEVTAQREYQLPLQDGVLELTVDPQNVMMDRENPDEPTLVRITAVLTDGHGVAIDNAPILFRTDRSRFYWLDRADGNYVPFFPNVARKYTGVVDQHHNEAPGTATVYLRGIMPDFFLDDFTLEVTVHIEASVEGYDVAADPGFIFYTRH